MSSPLWMFHSFMVPSRELVTIMLFGRTLRRITAWVWPVSLRAQFPSFRFHSRSWSFPSWEPAIANWLSSVIPIHFIESLCPFKVNRQSPFSIFQILSVKSPEPDTIVLLSLVDARHSTTPVCPSNILSQLFVCRFHSRTVLSLEPEIARFSPFIRDMQTAASVWPTSCTTWPSWIWYNPTVLSFDAETIKLSSLETCSDITLPWWALTVCCTSKLSQFHIVMSPLCEPVTTWGDLCMAAMYAIEPGLLLTHFALAMSHSFKESLFDPERPQRPSVVMATQLGCVAWWRMWSLGVEMLWACSFPVAFQSLTFLSFEPEMIVLQSVVMETQEIHDEWPIKVCWHWPVTGSQTFGDKIG